MMEAESNLVKTEAIAQRSYSVHRLAQQAANPAGGSVEAFIDQLEQDAQTAGEPAPTDP